MWSCVASLARRILVANVCPVNPLPRFFSSRLFAAFSRAFSAASDRVFFSSLAHHVREGDCQTPGSGPSPWCGEEGTRTPDLLLAKQALYQLSYSPDRIVFPRVRVLGFEPRTSALSELRSSQLSYTRNPSLCCSVQCECASRFQDQNSSRGSHIP